MTRTRYEEGLRQRLGSVEEDYGDLKREHVLAFTRDRDLETKLANARIRLSVLTMCDEDNWEDMKDRVEDAREDSESTFETLRARFRSRLAG